jgi:hypothetical protein
MGPSSQEQQEYGLLSSIGSYSANKGESATSASTDFWQGILSGDPTKMMQLLGPQVSAAQKQGQQKEKTTAEFGNRGGGTNAKMQMLNDTTRANIDSMIGNLTGQAASNLGNMGLSLLSQGASAGNDAFNAAETMQKQTEAQWGDIFNSIANVAGAVAGIPGMPSGASTMLKGAAGVLQS